MSVLCQSALLTVDAGHTGYPSVLTVVPSAWLSCASENSPVLVQQGHSRAGSSLRAPPLAGARLTG
jgi:hypothetical protein